MRILIVEDDAALRRELASFLGRQGHECLEASDLGAARAALGSAALRGAVAALGAPPAGCLRQSPPTAGPGPDLALVDLYLGEERGTTLLAEAAGVPVVMISGAGSIRDSVAALKAGAWDFLEKPLDPDRLLGIVRNLERSLRAERGLEAFREAWLAEHAVYAPASPFGAVLEEARRIAPSPLSVLISGPTGSGKELVARWIHYCSPRSDGPFIAVNCAAVAPELAESAFFGSRRGAYTGAAEDRPGWFQAAEGGSLFLDELGELPPALQAKLLRAAEEGEVQRLGSTAVERVSVRLISATNRDLEAEGRNGSFRSDLFFRLAQCRLRVPSLAERRGDIAPLATFFLAKSAGGGFAGSGQIPARAAPPGGGVSAGAVGRAIAAAQTAPGLHFDEEALAWLEARPWPGNVRELRSLVERARWLCPGPRIGAAELAVLSGGPEAGPESPRWSRGAAASAVPGTSRGTGSGRQDGEEPRDFLPLREARLAFERDYIRAALETAGGSVNAAAALLGLLPNNLSRRMRELGMR